MSAAASIASSKDVAEALSYWATAVGIIVTVVVGIAGLLKYFVDQQNEQWRRADELYGEFLDNAIAYPQFYGGNWAKRIAKDAELANQYTYYVGKFLWIFEQIIRSKAYDHEWRDDLKIILMEHGDYFASDRFEIEKPGYERALIRLIDEVVAERAERTARSSNA